MVSDPRIWYLFTALFAVTGLLHLVRALRRPDARRPTRIALGAASFLWAGAAALFRFAGATPAYVAAGLAVAVMAYGAWRGLGQQTPEKP